MKKEALYYEKLDGDRVRVRYEGGGGVDTEYLKVDSECIAMTPNDDGKPRGHTRGATHDRANAHHHNGAHDHHPNRGCNALVAAHLAEILEARLR